MILASYEQKTRLTPLPEAVAAPVIAGCRQTKNLIRCILSKSNEARTYTLPQWKLDRSYRPYQLDMIAISKMAPKIAAEQGVAAPERDELKPIYQNCAGALHAEWLKICVENHVLHRAPDPSRFDVTNWGKDDMEATTKARLERQRIFKS